MYNNSECHCRKTEDRLKQCVKTQLTHVLSALATSAPPLPWTGIYNETTATQITGRKPVQSTH